MSEQILNEEDELIKARALERKQLAQKRMAYISLFGIFVLTIFLLSPLVSAEKIETLSGVLTTIYLGLASIVGAFMGFTAYMARK